MTRKRPTIVEVARAAGVSITTVSVVLNERQGAVRISEATRQAVKAAAQRLGYIPHQAAQSLRRRRPTMLTLLTGSLGNPFFTDIAAGAHAASAERGHSLHIVDAGAAAAELQALAQLQNGSSAGLIVASGRHEGRAEALSALVALARAGLPAVMLCDRSPDPAIPAIRIDDAAGAAAATGHLLGLGHRRIAYLSSCAGAPGIDEASVDADRRRGYQRALQAAGVAADPAWIVQAEPTMAGGYALARALLAGPGPRPSALFCACDLMAIGALRALYEARIPVPAEMAVVGFDGVAPGQFTTPALTTVDQPRAAMGRAAVEMLFTLLDGAQPPQETIFPAPLLVRESCGSRGAGLPTAHIR